MPLRRLALAALLALAAAAPALGQQQESAEVPRSEQGRAGGIQSGEVPLGAPPRDQGGVEVVPVPDRGAPPAIIDRQKPPGGSVADAISGRALYHGNFCGHGNRGDVEPIDALDAACKRHDDCYDRAQRRSCACDRTLKQEALAAADNPGLSREVRARAGAVAQAAEVMDCERP